MLGVCDPIPQQPHLQVLVFEFTRVYRPPGKRVAAPIAAAKEKPVQRFLDAALDAAKPVADFATEFCRKKKQNTTIENTEQATHTTITTTSTPNTTHLAQKLVQSARSRFQRVKNFVTKNRHEEIFMLLCTRTTGLRWTRNQSASPLGQWDSHRIGR